VHRTAKHFAEHRGYLFDSQRRQVHLLDVPLVSKTVARIRPRPSRGGQPGDQKESDAHATDLP